MKKDKQTSVYENPLLGEFREAEVEHLRRELKLCKLDYQILSDDYKALKEDLEIYIHQKETNHGSIK